MAVMIALLSAFVIGVGLVMAAYVGMTRVPGMLAQRKLMGRLQSLSAPVDEPDDVKAANLVKTSNAGVVPGFDRMIAGTARGSALSRWIDQSGMKASISGVLLVSLVLAAVMAFVAMMITHTTISMPVGAAVGFSLPFMVLRYKRTRRLRTHRISCRPT